jgi:hypothetical protein
MIENGFVLSTLPAAGVEADDPDGSAEGGWAPVNRDDWREWAMAAEGPVDLPLTPFTGELVATGESVSIKLSPLFQALLNSARHLLSSGQHSAAVLVAQTAIEVCTERVIAGSLEKRGAGFLREWIDSRTRPYTLGTGGPTKSLYELLTGDQGIDRAPFWRRLTDHVKRRHAVGHRGLAVELNDAEDSVRVAGEAIQYLSGVAHGLGVDLSDR